MRLGVLTPYITEGLSGQLEPSGSVLARYLDPLLHGTPTA